ncbi:MAG TPA: DNA mismatch repair protein MutS [Elusimicrobia bacterium]|nr:MAG: DNA mismatch repair protein MutS [Elusimicrobia bacterium RIFOXYD2_FULL_34_30]HAM38395.1 DNA mismatch repair protein MutS [Elusimicrobiota bacterium]
MSELTPLMRQYQQIKNNHKDSILFFRLGDFYEMFYDDAKTASRVLKLTLTARQKVPMCGVPYHSSKFYIAKLIKEGFSVAICEQMEDPSKVKGLVKREVVRVITSGTVLEDNLLESKINNFLCAIYPYDKKSAIAFCDISTGEFFCQEIADDPNYRKLNLQLSKFTPSEILLPKSESENDNLIKSLRVSKTALNFIDNINFSQDIVKEKLAKLNIGLPEEEYSRIVCSAIITYIEKNQPDILNNLKNIKKISYSDYMILDELAIKNLELVEGLTSASRSGSLFEAIDRTITSMGARLLRKSILEPLLDFKAISERQDAIEFFINNGLLRMEIREILKNCQDIERLLSKIIAQTANGRDLVALKKSLKTIPQIKNKTTEILKSTEFLGNSEIIRSYFSELKTLDDIVELIEKSVVDEPPPTIKDGNLIKDGYNKDLDELKFISKNAKDWIAKFEVEEKQRTQINSLKVKYNSVFGYFIEVTKTNLDKVPVDYIRKQTIATGERFITDALKQKESMILGAQEKISALEYDIFLKLRGQIMENSESIQLNAKAIAGIDMFSAFAELAVENNYIRPKVVDTDILNIEDGRHPVIEKVLSGKFVPNDLLLNREKRIAIITGPNMSGKSTYLRQTAIIIIMAQIGSFVPAKYAEIGIVDSVFTRIGASDRLTAGESTFMVEMKEVANILNNATSKSYILLDEVGRGTSTFDGISIAWATIEYLKPLGAKVLFATHYFELTELSNIHPEIMNLNVSVKEWKGDVLFLHKIISGSADRSYGIHVGKLAGLPNIVIRRANELLAFFEKNYNNRENKQPELFVNRNNNKVLEISPLLEEIEKTNPDDMTPKDALQKIYEWKRRLDDNIIK